MDDYQVNLNCTPRLMIGKGRIYLVTCDEIIKNENSLGLNCKQCSVWKSRIHKQ